MKGMIRADFHTHTTYCDGKNSVIEMLEAAESANMSAIGFSGHSHTPFDESYCMSKEGTKRYIEEIKSIRENRKSGTEIYLGLEKDRFSNIADLSEFDYVIGSVHYVLKNGNYLPVDESLEIFKDNVDRFYGGDIFSFCEDYFSLVASFADDNDISIIGHFDLVTKFNEYERIFDTKNRRYVLACEAALQRLAESEKILEINTGAMSRKYRITPYPSDEILKKWCELGGKIIFSGDAHSKEGLCFAFDFAEKIAKNCGFNSALVLKNGNFEEVLFKN